VRRRWKPHAAAFADRSDAELLELAGRDAEAFGIFYRRHARAVLGFFIRRTADVETAADLTAETFAQAFLSRRRYRPTAVPAAAWLFAIARHQLAHFLRSARVADEARRRLGLPAAETSAAFERVDDLADLEGQRGAIRRALDDLSDGLGAAVRFRVVEGLAYREVAERLGCTEVAARQRVARGLDQLAHALEGLR
jgi:RNA polymerase sigma-70 factor (ECF subfamily)